MIQEPIIKEKVRNVKRHLPTPGEYNSSSSNNNNNNNNSRTTARNPLTNDGMPDIKESKRGNGKYKPSSDPSVTGKKVIIDLEHIQDESWKLEVMSRPKAWNPLIETPRTAEADEEYRNTLLKIPKPRNPMFEGD